MPIVHARVDERLIHGQVAMVWTNIVGATCIAVVNDEATKNDMIISALKIAKPAGVKLSILSKKRAVEKFEANEFDKDKVFIITKTIEDMADIIKAGIPTNSFNVGNVSKREATTQIKKSVYLTDNEIIIIKDLLKKGIKITAQMVPNESDQSIINLLP
ncbi:MAG: PTS sugar transporter subunit IIB [Erysipelotrichaceae bacterium]|nr:PTS sugar transporter subunit IIB [Erysipelotrichaceae bacterium]